MMKSGHLAFKIVIKKGKMLKIKQQQQSIDITHLLQCALKFQSYHAQWRSRGQVKAHVPGRINKLYLSI